MDVTQTTPTKVIARTSKSSDPRCRLCDKNKNGKHLYIYLEYTQCRGKKRTRTEDSPHLRYIYIYIHTQENDYLPKVICRVCAGFIEKMWNFRNLYQKNQVELRQNISIKRVSKFSPSSAKPPGKRQTFCSPERAVKQHLQFDVVPLQDITPKNVNARTHIEKSNTKSVYNKNTEYTVTRQLNEIHVGKLIHAVKSRHPIGIANVINKECPTIVMAGAWNCANKLCFR